MGLKKGYGNLLYSSSVTGSHHSLAEMLASAGIPDIC